MVWLHDRRRATLPRRTKGEFVAANVSIPEDERRQGPLARRKPLTRVFFAASDDGEATGHTPSVGGALS
jgi:hypothetical protein